MTKMIKRQRNIYTMAAMLVVLVLLITEACSQPPASTTSLNGEVQATEFQGVKLTPINKQNNNALAGTNILINRLTPLRSMVWLIAPSL